MVAVFGLPLTASGQSTFLSSRVGGLSLVGPAIAHPASGFYNPATLALSTGHHVFVDTTGMLASANVQLSETDSATGRPTGTLGKEGSSLAVTPQFFAGAHSDFGLGNVILGVAFYTPASTSFSYLVEEDGNLFDPRAQGAWRYHATDMDLFHLFVTPTVAVRVTDHLFIGLSFSYVFGTIDYGFVRDVALAGGRTLDRNADGSFDNEHAALDDCGNGRCDYGADAAAEAVRVDGLINGIAIGAGIVVRPHPRLTLGAGFQSGVVIGIGGNEAEGDAFVRRSQATFDNAEKDPAIPSPRRDLRGRAALSYALPHQLSAGANWKVNNRLALDLQFRWVMNSLHDQLEVRLTGAEFRDAPQIPDRIVHTQHMQDTYAVQIGGTYWLDRRFQLQVATMIESPATAEEVLTPALIDGWKLDGLVALRLHFARYYSLRLGYGLRVIPGRSVDRSAFNPAYMVQCVDRYFDVDLPVCQAAERGQGLASTVGEYGLIQQRLSLAFAVDIW